jgi:hypothetical protein
VEQEETWSVDWSSRISVLGPIFHQPIVGITLIGLVGIDDNIKIDITEKKEGFQVHLLV